MLSINPKGAELEDSAEEPSHTRMTAFYWHPNSVALF